jgi:hypothetical protein
MKDSTLLDKARSKAFTPGARDGRGLISLLETVDKEGAVDVVRALVRMGPPALVLALEASANTSGLARARLLDVVGRLAAPDDTAALEALVVALRDDHERVVKVAARALGRLGARLAGARPNVERALIEAKERANLPHLKATLIEALGKVGGSEALQALADESESRETGRAKTLLQRETRRAEESTIDASALAPPGTMVRFRCREGLEAILLEELGDRFRAKRSEPGSVEAMLDGPLSAVFTARTATHVTLPLVDRALREGEDLASAIANELLSARARALFRAFTRGPVRYRLDWARGGHRRALVFSVAALVSQTFVNDPTQSTWEARVDDSDGRLRIELLPKALVDPRFAYRVSDVPAASHPSIAAAIARLGGARDDDFVWDPFVGSALELCERARMGPYERLVGTDTNESSLLAARANLESAAVSSFSLEQADALTAHYPGVTLVLTNPPMGRRLVTTPTLDRLLVPFIANVAKSLVRGGRMAWVTPSPRHTDKAAARAGLTLERSIAVDMGGFTAFLQRLIKEK